MTILIRHASDNDLPRIVEILNHYIQNTAITFDTETYNAQSRIPWFSQFSATGRHQCFVAESEGRVIGYANSGRLRPKAAYDTSVEVSVYKCPNSAMAGVGKALYSQLFNVLATEDVHRAHAVITLPNDASIGIHEAFGFYPVGVLNEAGRKFGQFHTVQWMEKKLNS